MAQKHVLASPLAAELGGRAAPQIRGQVFNHKILGVVDNVSVCDSSICCSGKQVRISQIKLFPVYSIGRFCTGSVQTGSE